MNGIKISVILPVYNVEKYLSQCLESIINQTLREIEIICVDDGSTDNSLKILEEYAEKDDRIKVIKQANAGAGAARNAGIKVARGCYFSFLDSDDFFELDMLKTAYERAEKDKADIVVFDSDQYDESNDLFMRAGSAMRKSALPADMPFNHSSVNYNIFRLFIGWAWDKLFKAEFVRENNLTFQEQRTTNDLLFVFSAIVLADRISVVDKVLVHQRKNVSSSLSNTRERSWECFYRALKALKSNLISYDLYKDLEQDYINYALHFSLWNFETITGPKKEELYNKLRNEWFEELGVSDKAEDYFYDKKEYKKLMKIKSKAYDRYMHDEAILNKFRKIKHKALCVLKKDK